VKIFTYLYSHPKKFIYVSKFVILFSIIKSGAFARTSSRAGQRQPTSEGGDASDGIVVEFQRENLQGKDQRFGGTGGRSQGSAVQRNEEKADFYRRFDKTETISFLL
jgi:hypothetical protein